MKNNTAKQFVLQIGAFICLYLSLGFLISLAFSVITLKFPDIASAGWEASSAQDAARLAIAMVVVFFPAFLIFTRLTNSERRKTGQGYTGIFKWLVYLSILLGVLILLGDLATVISTFLAGEMTTRFILKAAVLFVITGAALCYYTLDVMSYWQKREQASIITGILSAVAITSIIAYSFAYVDSPAMMREKKLDQTQLNDLQVMQNEIMMYLEVSSSTLPTEYSAITDDEMPQAPAGRPDYEYIKTDKGFHLCATFAGSSETQDNSMFALDKEQKIINLYDWSYTEGRYCFERYLAK